MDRAAVLAPIHALSSSHSDLVQAHLRQTPHGCPLGLLMMGQELLRTRRPLSCSRTRARLDSVRHSAPRTASASQTMVGIAAGSRHRALTRRWFPIIGWVCRPLTSSWAGALQGTLRAHLRSFSRCPPASAGPADDVTGAGTALARLATGLWFLCFLGDVRGCVWRGAVRPPPPPGLATHEGLPRWHDELFSDAEVAGPGGQGALTYGSPPPDLSRPPLAAAACQPDAAPPVAVFSGRPQCSGCAGVLPPIPPGIFCRWP